MPTPHPRPAKPARPSRLAVAAAVAAVVTAGMVGGSAAQADDAARRHKPAPGVCSDDSLLFCADFERLPLGGAASLDWGIDTRNGTLTIEPAPAAGPMPGPMPAAGKPARPGKAGRTKALRVHTEGNGRAFLVAGIDPPGNSFHGRMRVFVKHFPTAPDWAHYTLVEATGAGAGVVRPIGGQWAPPHQGAFWGVGSDGGPTGDWTSWQTSAPSEAGRWQCLEWSLDASDNKVEVWIDGEAQPDLTVSTNDHGGADVPFVFPDFDTVKIGWQLYQGNPTPPSYDLWIDDVALSTDRLGC